jgi:hypothetical protein
MYAAGHALADRGKPALLLLQREGTMVHVVTLVSKPPGELLRGRFNFKCPFKTYFRQLFSQPSTHPFPVA